MMSLASQLPPTTTSNKLEVQETTAWGERRLRDGSNLKYRLTILQQPERARACGQGAKSHADRRPVDPPPVVELRLFKGDDQTDVTFQYNSNFFLFATLEQARPIANGRVVPTPAQAPVLTGVPVSGMAYLDRPAPAGYFIFPDLSVRHEGKYRLHFALFEECKEEEDRQAQEMLNFRLEVKSKPFTVYSAKKFPGLSESTALSRIVAEQGCRVRIRRDVRMRRRPDKPGREEESPEDEAIRRREASGAAPIKKEEFNRPAPTPNFDRPSYTPGHLSFSSNQPPAAPAVAAPPAPPAAPQPWNSQQQQRPQQQAPPPPPQPQAQAPQPVERAAPPPPPPQQAPQPASEYRRESGEFYKRASDGYRYHPYAAPSPYSSSRNSRDDLPPLKLAPLEPRMSAGLNSPSTSTPSSDFMQRNTTLPSPSSYGGSSSTPRTSVSNTSAPSSYNSAPTYPQRPEWPYPEKLVAAPEPAPRHAGSKRSWDRVFNESHVEGKMANGMRPNQTNYGIDADDDDDEDDFDYASLRMSYRRADGVQIVRSLPDETE